MGKRRHTSAIALLRGLGAGEEGFTVVFALVLLVLGIAVGAAALADTLASRSHANLDQRQRRALQAADFGVQEVLYRANQLNLDSLDLSGGKTGLPVCVVHESNGEWKTTSVGANGACPPITEEIGNHDSYQAEFIPNEKIPTNGSGVTFIEPKIVALGIDDNGNTSDAQQKVYARVDAGLGSIEPFKSIEANHDVTFKVPVLGTIFNGTARAAHDVKFKGETSLFHNFTAVNLKLNGEFLAPSTIEYGCEAPVDQGIVGDNVKFLVIPKATVVKQVGGCETPYFKRTSIRVTESRPDCAKSGVEVSCAGVTGYEPVKEGGDYVRIEKGETLTLEPGMEYVFCSLWTNGPIRLAAGASNASLPVRVFIDNPGSSRCSKFKAYKTETAPKEEVKAGSFYAGQGVGNFSLQALSPSQIQIYLAGNGEVNKTKFTSEASGLEQAFVLYAPQSAVTVSGLTFSGVLVGYDTTISSTVITQDLGLNNYPLSNSYGVFHEAAYTQCSPALPAALKEKAGLTQNATTDTAGC